MVELISSSLQIVLQVLTIVYAARMFGVVGGYGRWIGAWSLVIGSLTMQLASRVANLLSFDNESALFLLRVVTPLCVNLLQLGGLREISRIFHNLPDLVPGVDIPRKAVVTMNSDGLVVGWDLGAQALFGRSAEDAMGKPAALLIGPPMLHTALQSDTRSVEWAMVVSHDAGLVTFTAQIRKVGFA